jgi:hypothetical protein
LARPQALEELPEQTLSVGPTRPESAEKIELERYTNYDT